jgi:hypothetical protein
VDRVVAGLEALEILRMEELLHHLASE